MKAAIGIDESAASRFALDLFLKLDFPEPQVFLVHAIQSMMPDGSFPELSPEHPLTLVMRESEESGMEELRRAHSRALGRGVDAKMRLLKGSADETILDFVRQEDIDLVVVGRNRHSTLGELTMGSVARSLLHQLDRHILIAKRPTLRAGKLTVLLATDQSEEGNRCVETFAKLAPRGVGKVHLLTVNEIDQKAASQLVHGLAVSAEKAEHWVTQGLQTENECLGGCLRDLGYDCVAMVEEDGLPATAISNAANKAQADLIVVGAKPHGFLDRHLRRSVSEGLMARDDRPLLVLRP